MVTLAELIDEIGASESTIRRDLQMLDKEGKLKKVHGGAVAIGDDYFKNDYKVILRQEINKGEKNEKNCNIIAGTDYSVSNSFLRTQK